MAPNGCGLYDMDGNNWAWVQDWLVLDDYREAGRTDPTGPATGAWPAPPGTVFRGLRGGSSVGGEFRLYISHRSGQDPAIASISHTVRVARTVTQTSAEQSTGDRVQLTSITHDE